MNRTVLTDEQWQTIWTFLISHPRLYVGPPDTCRRFLNAVLWVLVIRQTPCNSFPEIVTTGASYYRLNGAMDSGTKPSSPPAGQQLR